MGKAVLTEMFHSFGNDQPDARIDAMPWASRLGFSGLEAWPDGGCLGFAGNGRGDWGYRYGKRDDRRSIDGKNVMNCRQAKRVGPGLRKRQNKTKPARANGTGKARQERIGSGKTMQKREPTYYTLLLQLEHALEAVGAGWPGLGIPPALLLLALVGR
jgi:hypothetical protein